MRFYLVIHTDDEATFGGFVPDLPVVAVAGDSVDEVIEQAREAITLYVAELIEDGRPVPEASTDIDLDDFFPEEGRAFLACVDVDVDAMLGAPKRVNISIRAHNLKIIDMKAKALGMDRSEFLSRAGVAVDPKTGLHPRKGP